MQDTTTRAEQASALPPRRGGLFDTRGQHGKYDASTGALPAAIADLQAASTIVAELITAEPGIDKRGRERARKPSRQASLAAEQDAAPAK